LAENTTNDNTFNVYHSDDIFIAQEIGGNRQYTYRLTDDIDTIKLNHREEILKYRLGKITPEDVVTIGDIFMIGKFTKLI